MRKVKPAVRRDANQTTEHHFRSIVQLSMSGGRSAYPTYPWRRKRCARFIPYPRRAKTASAQAAACLAHAGPKKIHFQQSAGALW